MSLNELKSVNEELLKCLKVLHQAILEKQKAVVSYNFEKLQKTIEKEENALFELQKLHKLRKSAFDKLKLQVRLQEDENSFESLLAAIKGRIPPEIWNEFNDMNSQIKKIIGEIQLINEQNKYLTENGRNFIKYLITGLVGTEKKSIVDRKI